MNRMARYRHAIGNLKISKRILTSREGEWAERFLDEKEEGAVGEHSLGVQLPLKTRFSAEFPAHPSAILERTLSPLVPRFQRAVVFATQCPPNVCLA